MRENALPILEPLWGRSADLDDIQIPLLVWWAVERELRNDRDAVIDQNTQLRGGTAVGTGAVVGPDVTLIDTVVGPGATITLPPDVVAAGHEVHHESELVVVIGTGGKDIPVEKAMDAVLDRR